MLNYESAQITVSVLIAQPFLSIRKSVGKTQFALSSDVF